MPHKFFRLSERFVRHFLEKNMIFYTFLSERPSRDEEHGTAYRLLEYALAERFGIMDGIIEKGENGKPFLKNYPGIKFNISHCRGLAVCGISELDIGVDAELIRGFRGGAVRRIFSPKEQRFIELSENPNEDFFRIWTLKESLCKNTGKGIFSGLSAYEFELSEQGISCAAMPEMAFTQNVIENKWVVSVCAYQPENEFILIEDRELFSLSYGQHYKNVR